MAYASAYQRRRHVWTLINGGPESAIHKTPDGGASWRKITQGLPEVDMGRIGMAISPADPDVLYAIIEADPNHAHAYLTPPHEPFAMNAASDVEEFQQLFARLKLFALEELESTWPEGLGLLMEAMPKNHPYWPKK